MHTCRYIIICLGEISLVLKVLNIVVDVLPNYATCVLKH